MGQRPIMTSRFMRQTAQRKDSPQGVKTKAHGSEHRRQ